MIQFLKRKRRKGGFARRRVTKNAQSLAPGEGRKKEKYQPQRGVKIYEGAGKGEQKGERDSQKGGENERGRL